VSTFETQTSVNACRPLPARTLGTLCACIVVIMLVAGLWPFHQPHNDVTWVAYTHGVSLGSHGTLLSASTFGLYDLEAQARCSLEIWLYPYDIRDTGTVLAFYSSDNIQGLSIRQDRADLVLQVERRDAQRRIITSEITTKNVFRQGTGALVTITSGSLGTVVYLDGSIIQSVPGLRMNRADLTGQLVVGTSPVQPDSFSGQLRGLAIYGRELTAADVLQHYQTWGSNGRPYTSENEQAVSLYLFDEHSGNVVHNHGSSTVVLSIPEKYTILHEKFLEPAWKEFHLRWGYWKSALINVGGFVPFGFVCCAYLSLTKPVNRAALTTVALGLAISLTIEVLQSYLPTRDSGTTDLITNTFGTCLGVMLYRWKPSLVADTLNRIPAIARITAGLR
jgi:VanZ like protein/concanavalin A-like lectin/glucanase superfamily protein